MINYDLELYQKAVLKFEEKIEKFGRDRMYREIQRYFSREKLESKEISIPKRVGKGRVQEFSQKTKEAIFEYMIEAGGHC